MAATLTKPQRKVLSTLRSLLRHVNTHFDNRTGTVLKKDVSPWTTEIMREFRANQFVKGREEVRALRTKATDILAGLQAVQEQKELFFRYGGISGESTEYRTAAANRVGVTIPEKIPLRDFDHSKYFRQ